MNLKELPDFAKKQGEKFADEMGVKDSHIRTIVIGTYAQGFLRGCNHMLDLIGEEVK